MFTAHTPLRRPTRLFFAFLRVLDWITPIGDLLARCWVAYAFLKAGFLKLTSWQSTVFLFTHEFSVPLLSPHVAATLGTGLEIILPIMLIIGLGGRLMIALFFLYNVVAVISYPHLWTPEGGAGLIQHINWGMLLALLMFHGPGKLSCDAWLRRRYRRHFQLLS